MDKQKLILVRGLPGSGKSTFANNLISNNSKMVHLEADAFHTVEGEYLFDVKKAKDAHKWCQSTTAYWLNRGMSVVVANTFTTINEIQPYLDIAELYNISDVEVVEMRESYGSIHNVPDEVIKKMKDRWEDYNQ